MQIPLPSFEVQQQIATFNLLFQQKNILRQQIIKKERQLHQAIIQQLTNSNYGRK